MRSITSAAKHELYVNAFYNAANDIYDNQDAVSLTKKLIIYGVKMVNANPKPTGISWDEAMRDFQFAEIIKTLIGTLSPGEFVNLFPIAKEFDGHKYETKDYFYTRDYIQTLPSGEPIGDSEAVVNFLWEYHNWEIRTFTVKIMGYTDNLRKLEGQPSAWELFCEEKGIKTYSKHTDQKGREFMVDRETGKSFRVKKRIPRYLKAVK